LYNTVHSLLGAIERKEIFPMANDLCKATVETVAGKITFEGPREFVENQVARWAESETSKHTIENVSVMNRNGEARPSIAERDLVIAKKPSNHLETVAVIAFALKQTGMEEFSEEDIRKAYLKAGVRPPRVVAQALRDAKNRGGYIESGSRRGRYRLSAFGDTVVRFDLPRA
jgi:hypothetical protein